MATDKKDTPNDITIDLLAQELCTGQIACGDGLSHTQIVKNKLSASEYIPNLYNLVPDNVYTPQVYVAFNFSSTFASNFEFEMEGASESVILQGKRLVNKNVIKNVASSLLNYYKYYYEYVLTYADRVDETIGEQNFLDKIDSETSLEGEEQAVEFINKIINFFLTSVSVSRVRNDVSSCSLSFRDAADYNFIGKASRILFKSGLPLLAQLFVPMVPFSVWARGRIYSDYMFPIFTGYITRTTPTNDQGYMSLKIDGKDCLELARITYENLNPAIIQVAEKEISSLNYFSKVFYGIDHFQIVQSMFLGGVVQYDSNTNRMIAIGRADANSVPGAPKISPIGSFSAADEESGNKTPVDVVNQRALLESDFSIKKMISRLSDTKYISSWGYNLTPYRVFGNASLDVYNSTFSTRLDILKGVASTVYYEFYTDGDGNVHYHPMRLSNDFLVYDSFYPTDVTIETDGVVQAYRTIQQVLHRFPHAQVIGSEEVTSLSKTKNIEELKTYLVLRGTPNVQDTGNPTQTGLYGYYMDETNIARFGYRRAERDCPMFNINVNVKDKDGKYKPLANAMAKVFLDHANGELYTMTASLVFRPELELAAPVYLVEDSEVFYVQSITHTIDIGNSATTVINASFGRWEKEPEPDLLSYMLHTELLDKAKLREVKYAGSVEGAELNIDFLIPATLHTEYLQKQYEEIENNLLPKILFP